MGIKASKICCPIEDCGEIIKDIKGISSTKQSALADFFDIHLEETHGMRLEPDAKKELHVRIIFIRYNGKIPYTDPFIALPNETDGILNVVNVVNIK